MVLWWHLDTSILIYQLPLTLIFLLLVMVSIFLFLFKSSDTCETWKNNIQTEQKCTNNLSFPVVFHIKNKKRYIKITKVYWQSIFSRDLPYQNKKRYPKVQKCTDNLSFSVIFHIKNLIMLFRESILYFKKKIGEVQQ